MLAYLLLWVGSLHAKTYEEILNNSIEITEQRHEACEMNVKMDKFICSQSIDHHKRCEKECDGGILKRTCECYRRRGPIKIYDIMQCKWNRHDNKCHPVENSLVLYPPTTTATTTTTSTTIISTTTTTTTETTIKAEMPSIKLKFGLDRTEHSMYCSDLVAHTSDWECSTDDNSKGTSCSRKCAGTHFSMLSKCLCSKKTGDCKWRFKIPSICVKLNDQFTYEHPELVHDFLSEAQNELKENEMENDFIFVEEENAQHNEPEEDLEEEAKESMQTMDGIKPSNLNRPPGPQFKRKFMQRRKPLNPFDKLDSNLTKFNDLSMFPATAENAQKADNGEITGIFAARSAEEFEQFLRTFNDWDELTVVAIEKGHLQKIQNEATLL